MCTFLLNNASLNTAHGRGLVYHSQSAANLWLEHCAAVAALPQATKALLKTTLCWERVPKTPKKRFLKHFLERMCIKQKNQRQGEITKELLVGRGSLNVKNLSWEAGKCKEMLFWHWMHFLTSDTGVLDESLWWRANCLIKL